MVNVPLYPPAASKACLAAAASNLQLSPHVSALYPSTAGDTQPVAGVRVPLKICLVISSRSMAREIALRNSTLSLSCGSAEENQIPPMTSDSFWDVRSGKSSL